jgi:hypothetical protein
MKSSTDEQLASCPICYESLEDYRENCLGNDEESPSGTIAGPHHLCCTHIFCHTCIRKHCDLAIEERRLPIQCPDARCQSRLTEQEIHSILGDDTIAATRYHRAYKLVMDPSLVECFKCNTLLPPTTAVIRCPCGHEFCSIHGDAHIGQTCLHYTTTAFDVLSATVIQSSTKPCPHCTARIEKEAGCNHIVCPSCDGDWCWACQNPKLTGDRVRYCSVCKESYLDHRKLRRHQFFVCLALPFLLPIILVYMVVTFLVCLLTCGCCCLELEVRKRWLVCVIMTGLPVLVLLSDVGLPWGQSLLEELNELLDVHMDEID